MAKQVYQEKTANPYDTWQFRIGLTAIAAVSAGMAMHPVDTMKIRMQIQGELSAAGMGKEHSTIFHGAYNVVSKEGVRGLYKGISASFCRESTYSTMRLGLYEPFKNLVGAKEENAPIYLQAVAGLCSGLMIRILSEA